MYNKIVERSAEYWLKQLLVGMCVAGSVGVGVVAPTQASQKSAPMHPVEVIAMPVTDVQVEVVTSREEQIEILTNISNSIRRNYESISTLSGVYRLQDRQPLTDPELLKSFDPDDASLLVPAQLATQAMIEFAIDLKGDRIYTCWQPVEPRMLIEQSTFRTAVAQGLAPQETRAVISGSDYVFTEPNTSHGAFVGFPEMGAGPSRAAFRELRSKADEQRYGMVIDPRKLFQGTIPYSDEMDAVRQLIEKAEDNPRSVLLKRVKGNDFLRYSIIVTATVNGEWHTHTTMVDSRAGFNVVVENFDAEGVGTTQSTTMGYCRVGEVFTPAEIVFSLTGKQKDLLAFQRTLVLEKVSVNSPVGDEMFDYAKLGLGDGDRVVDRIEGVGFIVNNGRLEKASTRNADPNPTPERHNRSVIMACVVTIALIGVWFAIRRQSVRGKRGPVQSV